MAFSEKTKRTIRERSAFRCCICHKPFVEIHHIIPQSEGGSDEIKNAAPLCSSCHDLYGGNPEKRKTIQQMRDNWFKIIERRYKNLTNNVAIDKYAEIMQDSNHQGALHSKSIAIYHNVFADENFITAAKHIHALLLDAQNKFPNHKRILYLDIDEHRYSDGAFDHDMFELQRHYILGFLAPFFSEINIPIVSLKFNKLQRNDIPNSIDFKNNLDKDNIHDAIDNGISSIWIADRDKAIIIDET
mgnify:CR=1 FL=1